MRPCLLRPIRSCRRIQLRRIREAAWLRPRVRFESGGRPVVSSGVLFADYDATGLPAGVFGVWPDSSGLGHDTGVHSGSPVAGVFDGLPGVDMTDESSGFQVPDVAAGPLTIFAVGDQLDASLGWQFFGGVVRVFQDSGADLVAFSSSALDSGVVVPLGVYVVVAAVFAGASSRVAVWPDGVVVNGDSGVMPDGSGPFLGSTDRPATGYLREFLVYEGALSTGDVSSVVAWLRAKWSV